MNKSLSTKFEEVQLVYRNRTKAKDRPLVTCPKAAFEIFLDNWDKGQIGLLEESKVLLLDKSLRLMSIASLSKGGMDSTIIDPRILFAIALKRRACRIIVAHNHPSGNLSPSDADIRLTKDLMKASKFLKISLDDHLIITQDNYRSILDCTNSEFGSLPF